MDGAPQYSPVIDNYVSHTCWLFVVDVLSRALPLSPRLPVPVPIPISFDLE